MEKVYIAGPITGFAGYEKVFENAEKALKSMGYNAVNPVKLCRNMDPEIDSHEKYMRKCIPAMLDCTYILMLPGWEQSSGATLEKLVADRCGIVTMEIKKLSKKWM